MDTMVWSMKVIATAKIIAARITYLDWPPLASAMSSPVISLSSFPGQAQTIARPPGPIPDVEASPRAGSPADLPAGDTRAGQHRGARPPIGLVEVGGDLHPEGGNDAVEPGRHIPVGPAQDLHDRGNEDHAHQAGIDEDGGSQAEPEHLEHA